MRRPVPQRAGRAADRRSAPCREHHRDPSRVGRRDVKDPRSLWVRKFVSVPSVLADSWQIAGLFSNFKERFIRDASTSLIVQKGRVKILSITEGPVGVVDGRSTVLVKFVSGVAGSAFVACRFAEESPSSQDAELCRFIIA